MTATRAERRHHEHRLKAWWRFVVRHVWGLEAPHAERIALRRAHHDKPVAEQGTKFRRRLARRETKVLRQQRDFTEEDA
jgi:hypothetical protein